MLCSISILLIFCTTYFEQNAAFGGAHTQQGESWLRFFSEMGWGDGILRHKQADLARTEGTRTEECKLGVNSLEEQSLSVVAVAQYSDSR